MYTAHPNPEGWHRKTGEAHAEIVALDDAGANAKGATVYVTLEPCSHEGKTPPCVDALIAAGVSNVIAAMVDPNAKVSGDGHGALEGAGIPVRTGLMQHEAASLNAGFLSRMQRRRPLVRLKIAASLDGRTAMAKRARSGAVMVGIGTVIADDPGLNVRRDDIDNDDMQPLRVVLDSKLRMPASSRMLALPGSTAIFCSDDAERRKLVAAGASIHVVATGDGGVDLAAVMNKLADLEINEVLAEAGPTLAGSLIDSGLVDELVIYQAPHIMGSETRAMFTTPNWQKIGQRLNVEIVDVRNIGADLRITATPVR
jgi:diaminohydroxyphosphoribosylaminopyrimidine deaminase/5-amino-6-(5-phosphoribosylamino)uracil reductase